MAFEFKLPDIGEGVVEGEIVKWLVKPGDTIQVDQPMVEVMTDKATVVIPSPKAGTVLETRGKEGDIAKVHAVLVVIDESGATAAAPAPKAAAPAPAPAPAPAAKKPAPAPQPAPRVSSAPRPSPPRAPEPRAAAPSAGMAMQPQPQAPARPNGSNGEHVDLRPMGSKVLAAPATRRLARELGVELSRVLGTGPAGRVTSEDVRRAAEGGVIARAPAYAEAMEEAAPVAARATTAEGDERIQVRGMRKRIWENMAQSAFTAAHFTFVEECDATELVKMRDRFNARLAQGEEKLSFLPFIVKAVVASLKKFPDLNSVVDDDAMEYVRRSEIHMGIAAATERGLMVPVVRHADRRSILDLAREIKRLGDAARSGKISTQDLGGSTFTITSLGKDGGIFATPIINYPEVAIMGVHKLSKRPMVRDDQIVIRDMMNLSLSFDHRLIDGHVGAAFTYSVIRLLENPERLMMEMT